MKKIELLAPAGDKESLIAAIQNGVNAIYLGGTLFNARAFAKNFDLDELQWAVQYAHLRDVKIYVTVNTLYKDSEFEELIKYLDKLYEIQVDALIIQDIGLFHVVKQRYRDFEIHMSTQSSLMNQYGVEYFEKMGAQRVVLARENTLDEIKKICSKTSLDIEVFVHGALCVCYSGQCLMSSFIGKRSGNRGACAQPCRLQYQLVKNGEVLDNKTPFLLSPRDLMTIENIGELIDAGVTSFKVEGRMKKPEYVASVIRAYRKAIDAYLCKEKVNLENDIYQMKSMFNRDYTQGYIFKDSKIVSGDYPGNKGILIGKVTHYNRKQKRVRILLSDELSQGDSIVFEDIDKGRPVNKLYYQNKLINHAKKGDEVEIEFDYFVSSGNVRKTVNTIITKSLQKTYQNQEVNLPISMTFYAHAYRPAMLTVKYKDIKVTKKSDEIVEQALKTPLSRDRVQEQLSKLGNSCFALDHIQIDMEDQITLAIKTINQMRRDCIEELTKKLENQIIHHDRPQEVKPLKSVSVSRNKDYYILVSRLDQLEIVLQYNELISIAFPFNHESMEAYNLCQNASRQMILFIPRICKDEDIIEIMQSEVYTYVKKVIVNDYGSYYAMKDKERILGTGLNIYNSYSCDYFQEEKILSLEIGLSQIQNLQTNQQKCIVQIYGKIENMISEYCPISQYYFGYQKKNCQLCKHAHYSLLDRKGEMFDLMMDEKCRMHLLNCRTLFYDKFKNLKSGGLFVHFTNEDNDIIKNVIDSLLGLDSIDDLKSKMNHTYGYFKD